MPKVLLKLDISKVFDSVQWPFLLEVMQQMWFGPRWRSWICGVLATSTTKVMVNGPGDTIYNCKGLRQGDPISSMLFILTMVPLQRLFERATTRGLLEPLAHIGMRQRLSIFADDVVVFIKPKPMELHICKNILVMFGEASGLRINMVKSVALPIRCNDQEAAMVCEGLGCPRGNFPIKYLGLPLSLRKQSAAQL
uniref:Reverse transcriptase domain-containing protein n=1 Tax=Triticum urartu TaxID=4572 RepID=A0A8R7K072_TRIUA